jgi:hypothetical protein
MPETPRTVEVQFRKQPPFWQKLSRNRIELGASHFKSSVNMHLKLHWPWRSPSSQISGIGLPHRAMATSCCRSALCAAHGDFKPSALFGPADGSPDKQDEKYARLVKGIPEPDAADRRLDGASSPVLGERRFRSIQSCLFMILIGIAALERLLHARPPIRCSSGKIGSGASQHYGS